MLVLMPYLAILVLCFTVSAILQILKRTVIRVEKLENIINKSKEKAPN